MRLLPFFLFFILVQATGSAGFAQCKSLKNMKEEFRNVIKPYDFEGISAGILNAGKTRSISVSVFSRVKYRLNFRTEGFDSPVIIKVVTVNRQVLWSNEKDTEASVFEFIPHKTDKYFVEFSAPGSSDEDARGCVAVVLSSRPY